MARYPVLRVLEKSNWRRWRGGTLRRFDGVRKPRGGAESFVHGGGNRDEMAFDGVSDSVDLIVDESEARNVIILRVAVKHIRDTVKNTVNDTRLTHFEERL